MCFVLFIFILGLPQSGKVRGKSILLKVGISQGLFVSQEGVSKSLFTVREFYLNVAAAKYFIRCLCIDKAILF